VNTTSDSVLSPIKVPQLLSVQSSFSYHSSHTGHSSSPSLSDSTSNRGLLAASPTDPMLPTHRLQQLQSTLLRPNSSRGSLSSNNPTRSRDSSPSISTASSIKDPVLPTTPIVLDMTNRLGPVDPRQYSAVTGFRTIDNFVIEGDAGKGAYGTVKRAREKSNTGEPIGVSFPCQFDEASRGWNSGLTMI
jgi:hypothetical protein